MARTDAGEYSNGVLYYSVDPARIHLQSGQPVTRFAELLGLNDDRSALLNAGEPSSLSRGALRNRGVDPRRNLYADCGFPDHVTPQMFKDLYDRNPIAARVCEVVAKESWQVQPSVFEDSDPDVVTEFEAAWDELGKSLQPTKSFYQDEMGSVVWSYLLRADVLSRIGQYGVIYLGLDDGMDPSWPVDGWEEWNSVPADSPEKDAATLESYVKDMNLTPEEAKRKLADLKRAERDSFRARAMQGQGTTWTTPSKAGKTTTNQWVDPCEVVINSRGRAVTKNRATQPFDPKEDGPADPSTRYKSKSPKESADEKAEAAGTSDAVDADGKKSGLRLLYLRVFSEANASITQFETNPSSPRNGLPTQYQLTLNARDSSGGGATGGQGLPTTTITVHWTRVVHVVNNRGESEVFHTPDMRAVFNHLLSLEKMYGAAPEGYWQSCFNLLFFETNPQLGGNVVVNKAEVRSMTENLLNGLQRSAVLKGMTAKAIGPSVVDPTPFVDCVKKAICNYIGVPMRVFDGSERGELASSQDDGSWNDDLRRVQLTHNNTDLIIPFTDRLILCTVLPEPKPREVELPDAPPEPGEEGAAEGGESDDGIGPKPDGPETGGKAMGVAAGQAGPPQAAAPPGGAKKGPPKPPTANQRARVYRRTKKVLVPVWNAETDEVETEEKEVGSTVVETVMGYSIEWPDLESQTKGEKATVIQGLTTALVAYAGPGAAPTVMPPMEYFTKVWDMEPDEVQDMLDSAASFQEEQAAAQIEQQAAMIDEGLSPDPTAPPPNADGEEEDPNADPFQPARPKTSGSPVGNELTGNCGGPGSGVPGPCPGGHRPDTGMVKGKRGYVALRKIDLQGQRLEEVSPLRSNDDKPIILKKHGAGYRMVDGFGRTNGLLNAKAKRAFAIVVSDADLAKRTTGGDDEDWNRKVYRKYVPHLRYHPTTNASFNGPPVGNAFCPTGKGGGVDPTCSPNNPSGVKSSPTGRAKMVRDEADKVETTTEQIYGKKVDRDDYDDIEEGMSQSERRRMERYLDSVKDDWVDEQMRAYDSDDDIDHDQAAKDAGWSDSDVQDKVVAHVRERFGDRDLSTLDDDVEAWYGETRKHGPDAVDELADHLHDKDWDHEVVEHVRELKHNAESEVEEKIDEQREHHKERRREDLADLADGYDDSEDRAEYLREFYDEHGDETRYAGESVKNVWGRDGKDRAYTFETRDGDEYHIWTTHSKIGDATVLEVGFSDDKDSHTITGAGNAHEVFKTVTTAITALAVKDDVPALSFTAAEPSRQRLYDRLVRTTASAAPTYLAVAIPLPNGGKRYVLMKRDQFGHFQGIAKSLGSDIQPEILVNAATWELLTPQAKAEWFRADGWPELPPTMTVPRKKGSRPKTITDNAFCPTGEGGGVDPTCGEGGGAAKGDAAGGAGKGKAGAGKGDGDGNEASKATFTLVRQRGNTHEGVPTDVAKTMTDKPSIHRALDWQENMTVVRGSNGANRSLPDETRPELSSLERGALQKYSYKNDAPMNQLLRGSAEVTKDGTVLYTDREGNRSTTPYRKEYYEEMQKQMDSAFAKAPVLKKPVKVVRGMNLSDENLKGFIGGLEASMKSGSPHPINGYLSTSTPTGMMAKVGLAPGVGKPFRGNVTMKINAVHGLDMKPHTQLTAEGEFLLPQGSKFSVKSIVKKADGYHVELDQHPPEKKATENVFCPTGEGGGVDPTCGTGSRKWAESDVERVVSALPHYAPRPDSRGGTLHFARYKLPDGGKLEVDYSSKRRDIHIDWIGEKDGTDSLSGRVGMENLKVLAKILKKDFPDAETVSGFRVGGRKKGSPEGVVVPLDRFVQNLSIVFNELGTP